ncbi:unnamed protein product [Arctia plantaginis]|uniref:Uncharacterized protein n=1 Tax=Arctia plantaginis TaxID=874455 RepID=A0A8S0YR73_ARCPL|nr:unnamed protein product [Arctia plantaginis]
MGVRGPEPPCGAPWATETAAPLSLGGGGAAACGQFRPRWERPVKGCSEGCFPHVPLFGRGHRGERAGGGRVHCRWLCPEVVDTGLTQTTVRPCRNPDWQQSGMTALRGLRGRQPL